MITGFHAGKPNAVYFLTITLQALKICIKAKPIMMNGSSKSQVSTLQGFYFRLSHQPRRLEFIQEPHHICPATKSTMP